MLTLTHELSDMVADAFEGCGYGRDWGQVSGSDRLDLCQFQCNGAFACAKRYHKAPLAIAEEVAAVLARNPLFARVDAAPPGFPQPDLVRCRASRPSRRTGGGPPSRDPTGTRRHDPDRLWRSQRRETPAHRPSALGDHRGIPQAPGQSYGADGAGGCSSGRLGPPDRPGHRRINRPAPGLALLFPRLPSG